MQLAATTRTPALRLSGMALIRMSDSVPEAVTLGALDAILQPVDALLAEFLDGRVADLLTLDAALEPIGREIEGLVNAGGKRLRPAFVYWGYRATGAQHSDSVVAPAAAVELLHTFALIHDDVMDRSPERRGRPAVHTALAAVHGREGLEGDPTWFGVGGAILAGDLAFVWADQLFDGADLPAQALDRARRVFGAMRVEVMAGQYLDLRLAGLKAATQVESLHVALLKSGRYTVTRPLQLGAAIGGADPALDSRLRAYGDALGVAFQLRDDVLGLFGDPGRTGKGALSDLREGKRTLLLLQALERASASQREQLARIVGNPDLDEDDARAARDIVVSTGALAEVETLLSSHLDSARAALDGIVEPARAALEELAALAAYRSV
jgi:geranylgeranyl diphosphate synthase, type I